MLECTSYKRGTMSNRIILEDLGGLGGLRAITHAGHDPSLQNHIIGVLAPLLAAPTMPRLSRSCLLCFRLSVTVYCKAEGAVNRCDASWVIMHRSWCKFSHRGDAACDPTLTCRGEGAVVHPGEGSMPPKILVKHLRVTPFLVLSTASRIFIQMHAGNTS